MAGEGVDTRLRWAMEYADAAMRLTPADKRAVENGADHVVPALGDDTDNYFEGTRKKIEAWRRRLAALSAANGGATVLARVEARAARYCGTAHASDASCPGRMKYI
jgi:hypothetical protein